MATVKRYTFARHLRTAPTSYVLHLQAGKLRHTGAGLAFWFRPLSAVISEIPVDCKRDRQDEQKHSKNLESA